MTWYQFVSFSVLVDSLIQPIYLPKGFGEEVVGQCVLRADRHSYRVVANPLVPLGRLHIRQAIGEVEVDPEIAGVHPPGFLQASHTFFVSANSHECVTEVVKRR